MKRCRTDAADLETFKKEQENLLQISRFLNAFFGTQLSGLLLIVVPNKRQICRRNQTKLTDDDLNLMG